MQLAFVIPGHYEYLHSSSDSKQIIRVLGEGERKNYFKLADGRELSETEILDNYIFLNTSSSEDNSTPNLNFGNITEDEVILNEIESEPEPKVYVYQPDKKTSLENPIISDNKNNVIKIHTKSDEDIFIDTILSKISKDNDLEKFGEVQFKTVFEIPIKFEFKYDLEKLRQILKIFGTENINIKKFIERILLNDLDNIQDKISEAVMEFLTEEPKLNDFVKKVQEIKENQESAIVGKYANTLNNF